jgi:hypothetical protein
MKIQTCLWILKISIANQKSRLLSSVENPDPHVYGPSVSGSISQRCGSGSGSFPFLIKVLTGLK